MFERCATEIESLHEWFGAWFRGEINAHGFDRFSDALGARSRLIDPGGVEHERTGILAAVQAGHGGRDVSIWVTDIEPVWTTDVHAVIRYAEHQLVDGTSTERISTASLRADPSAPGGVSWLHVHETWKESEV